MFVIINIILSKSKIHVHNIANQRFELVPKNYE